MESYFIEKSAENTDSSDSCDKIYQSYNFSDENLANIPHPDDNSFSQAYDCDDIHLPPPPGTCDHSPLPRSSYFEKNTSPSPDSSASPSYLPEDDLCVPINTANIPIPDSYRCEIENISLPPPLPPPSAPPPLPQLPLPNTPPEGKEWKNDKEINAGLTECEKIIESPDAYQKMLEDSKYSPSKVESDDESQEFAVVKPKVLGKEAAKKRLMAFSLSKQPSKKNKVTPVKSSKEKPSNSNKSSNVQDVFRTTISEIEAEKRKMLKNMPSHLASELTELSKHSTVKTPSSNSETHKNGNAEPNVKDNPKEEASSKVPTKVEEPVKESKSKSPHKSKRSSSKAKRSRSRSNRRSRSRSKRRRRSRSRSRSRRRSRSRSTTNQNRNRKRSSSRSRQRRRGKRSDSKEKKRSYSRDKSGSEEKSRGDYYVDYSRDWKSFKAAGHVLQVEPEDPRLSSKEWKKLKQPVIDWSSTVTRAANYFRPTFNLLKRKTRPMASLRVTPVDPEKKIQMLYLERTIRYTRTRPVIHWAENPAQTTDYCMSKEHLLENSDDSVVRILTSIIESGKKRKTSPKKFDEPPPLKSRPWYPRRNYLSSYSHSNSEKLDVSKNLSEGTDKSVSLTSKKEVKQVEKLDNKKKVECDVEVKSEKEKKNGKERNEERASREKREDSGCDNSSSKEDDKRKSKERVVEDIKMKVDVRSRTVRVRSRWDSDPDEANVKEATNRKEENIEISTTDDEEKMSLPLINENLNVKTASLVQDVIFREKMEGSGNLLKSNTQGSARPSIPVASSHPPAGNLVSEYEEFLKMVSFDSCGAEEVQHQQKRLERPSVDVSLNQPKSTKVDKPTGVEKSFRVETTEWDQESDREERSTVKKHDLDKSEAKFSTATNENLDSKKKKNKKNVVVKKKSGKMKLKKKKLSKKTNKAKKKNCKDSSSSDSSSESSDSDSDTDSDESSTPKRKKKKTMREKKKSKRDSSSESDSDESYDGKGKKKKMKKKKKKGKRRKSSTTSESDEVHNALMKQLDMNKQLIMKKIEEIDYISEKSGKKGKDNQQKKKEKHNVEESELLDKYLKSGKKKKGEAKFEKDKKMKSSSKKSELHGKGKKGKSKKGKSSSESESEDSEGSVKKKKLKRGKKRKRSTSDSSTSEEKTSKKSKIQKLEKVPDIKGFKTKEKKDKSKKVKKIKKKKKKEYSSSDSDSEKPVKKDKKRRKSEENVPKDWKDSFLLDEPTFKTSENRSEWEGKELNWEKSGAKTVEGGKKGGDWEESSSVEESPPKPVKRESSWDEEDSSVRTKTEVKNELLGEKEDVRKDEKNNVEQPERADVDEKSSSGPFGETDQQISDSLKTSMSNFSFNENSFCAFGQELSRDFFLMEPTFSNSAQLPPEKTKEAIVIEPRPFHSVSKSSDAKKSGGSELYSPGYTESEASDAETDAKTGRIVDNSNACSESREEVYDPLNCESDGSAGNGGVELGNIPLPRLSDILLPGELKSVSKDPVSIPLPDQRPQPRPEEKRKESDIKPSDVPPATSKFGFMPVTIPSYSPTCILKEKLNTTTKKGVMSMMGQRKLKSKAAAVFQDESDDEFEVGDKLKQTQNEVVDNLKEKMANSIDVSKNRGIDNRNKINLMSVKEVKEKRPGNKLDRGRSVERSEERELRSMERREERERRSRERSEGRERRSRERSEGRERRSRERSEGRERRSMERREERERRSRERSEERERRSRERSEERERRSMERREGRERRSMERREGRERRSSGNKGWRENGGKKDYSFVIGNVQSPRTTEGIPSLKFISPRRGRSEIKSDSFEIEPLNSYTGSTEVEETIQRIPVVTGLGAASGNSWSRSRLTAYNEFPEVSPSVMNTADSFDLYTVQDPKFRNQSYDKDFMSDDMSPIGNEKTLHGSDRSKTDKRKSRSRSLSPRKRRKSKSPRGRSPRKRSPSPKRRDRSPYSPRRRSPKRKSYRSSRSPERRRKSPSRSPRKRRNDSGRRSRSLSPRKHRSPKRRCDSPRRDSFSPRRSISPRRDSRFNHNYSDSLQKRIPVIGGRGGDDVYMEISPNTMSSPRLERDYSGYMNESSRTMSELNDGFYNRDYGDEFGIPSYSDEVSLNNLITVKNHDIGKPNSPERLSLDQRIELELAGQSQNEQYSMSNQFPDMNSTHFPSSYNSENTNSGESFYQNSEVSSQYFNGRPQQSNYGQFPPYTNSQGVKSSVLQVGNIVEVVPTLQHPPPPPVPSKPHQILQVGNVLQVVPSPKIVPPPQAVPPQAVPPQVVPPQAVPPQAVPPQAVPPQAVPPQTVPPQAVPPQAVPPPETQNYGPPSPMPPVVKTQKATAVVAPSSITPTPNPEAVINPLIKAIQLEREKRRKEKEKRKAEREARRKARQLRREAKLMSVNEKLKKSVQDEGLMLGQEVEDDELLDGSDIPSPPIPVEIITVSSQNTLPPAGKGILITAGFMPKPPSEKKEVKFADGVCPGEGTSTSGGEDIASPPPKPKLPKEKRYKRKKTKVKKKVKVQIIRQIIQDEDDDEEDDLSPPPPPPGDPPPVFFARFPFVGDAQFPIYQTQTTTTTLTTVQYPTPSFQ